MTNHNPSNGWEPMGKGKTYSWPNFRWYQFIQKRRWRKFMSQFTLGPRIKL